MEIHQLEDLGVDRRIILKWIFKKWDGETWERMIWVRTGQVAGACGSGNELSVYIKCWEFLDQLRAY
jgi:hypothetical protein